jgi:hypothetical protein
MRIIIPGLLAAGLALALWSPGAVAIEIPQQMSPPPLPPPQMSPPPLPNPGRTFGDLVPHVTEPPSTAPLGTTVMPGPAPGTNVMPGPAPGTTESSLPTGSARDLSICRGC